MVLWIVIGAVVLGLLVLALAVRPVLGPAARARAGRCAGSQTGRPGPRPLGAQLAGLQERAEAVQERAVTAQERIAVIKAGRGRA